MAGKFIKCPRCELNYIDSEKQTYCNVCLAELKLGPSLKFADLEDEDIEEDIMDICPVCKINYIKFNEDMCEDCRKEKKYEKERLDDTAVIEDDNWKEFLDDDIIDDDISTDTDFSDEIDAAPDFEEAADEFDEAAEDFDFEEEDLGSLDDYEDEDEDEAEDEDFG